MGNCCRKPSSSMEWAGDDWGSLRSSKVFDEGLAWKEAAPEKKRLLTGEMRTSSSSDNNNNGKVTIKISKKELEELMAGLGMNKERQGSSRASSAEQVLVRLLSARDNHHHNAHHSHWRPVLQSIPELD
ncbi:hypothetical protein QN277_005379 [Acacia crassicarpa]|uniref:Uncharacterized protein n=1 Tax=Acacia crassicarpa TaxID=499986 RepID=A0AAE1MBG7_9FABA|nr:hypothetical protein QN277_005379 [Acacia crassicarpa]